MNINRKDETFLPDAIQIKYSETIKNLIKKKKNSRAKRSRIFSPATYNLEPGYRTEAMLRFSTVPSASGTKI